MPLEGCQVPPAGCQVPPEGVRCSPEGGKVPLEDSQVPLVWLPGSPNYTPGTVTPRLLPPDITPW